MTDFVTVEEPASCVVDGLGVHLPSSVLGLASGQPMFMLPGSNAVKIELLHSGAVHTHQSTGLL